MRPQLRGDEVEDQLFHDGQGQLVQRHLGAGVPAAELIELVDRHVDAQCGDGIDESGAEEDVPALATEVGRGALEHVADGQRIAHALGDQQGGRGGDVRGGLARAGDPSVADLSRVAIDDAGREDAAFGGFATAAGSDDVDAATEVGVVGHRALGTDGADGDHLVVGGGVGDDAKAVVPCAGDDHDAGFPCLADDVGEDGAGAVARGEGEGEIDDVGAGVDGVLDAGNQSRQRADALVVENANRHDRGVGSDAQDAFAVAAAGRDDPGDVRAVVELVVGGMVPIHEIDRSDEAGVREVGVSDRRAVDRVAPGDAGVEDGDDDIVRSVSGDLLRGLGVDHVEVPLQVAMGIEGVGLGERAAVGGHDGVRLGALDPEVVPELVEDRSDPLGGRRVGGDQQPTVASDAAGGFEAVVGEDLANLRGPRTGGGPNQNLIRRDGDRCVFDLIVDGGHRRRRASDQRRGQDVVKSVHDFLPRGVMVCSL